MNTSTNSNNVNRMNLVSEVLCDFHHKLAQGILHRVTLMHQVQYQPTPAMNKVPKGTRGPSKVSRIAWWRWFLCDFVSNEFSLFL